MPSSNDVEKSPETPGADKKPGGLGRIAVRGTAYVFIGQFVVKVGALASQWVLGYYLSAEQFGLWALALSIVCLVDSVRDMGAHKVLIQRGSEFEQLSSPVFKIGLGFNLLGAAALIAIAPVMAHVYDHPTLAWLIIIAALTIPFQTPVTVMRSKLSIDLRFKTMAHLHMWGQLIKSLSMIVLAILGFGVYSFVIPVVLMGAFNIIAFRWAAGPMPPLRPMTREHFWSIFTAVKWIAISAIAGALILQGDRLVIGWFENTATVGVYFFGFQLIISTVNLFGSGAIGVFMPTLAKLNSDPQRQSLAYQRMVRVSSVVFTVICATAAIVSGPAIHLLWGGRWDASIPVAQVMSLSLCTVMIGPVAMSFIEATGRWRLRAAIMGTEMLGVLVAAAVGSYLGGLVEITICIASWKAVMGVAQCLIAGRLTGINPVVLIRSIAGPILLAAVCGGASYFGLRHLFVIEPSWLMSCVELMSFGVLFTAGLFLLLRHRFDETFGAVRHLLPGQTT